MTHHPPFCPLWQNRTKQGRTRPNPPESCSWLTLCHLVPRASIYAFSVFLSIVSRSLHLKAFVATSVEKDFPPKDLCCLHLHFANFFFHVSPRVIFPDDPVKGSFHPAPCLPFPLAIIFVCLFASMARVIHSAKIRAYIIIFRLTASYGALACI